MESFRSDLAPSPIEDSQPYLEEAAKTTVPVVVPSKVKLNPLNSPAPLDEKSPEGKMVSSYEPPVKDISPEDKARFDAIMMEDDTQPAESSGGGIVGAVMKANYHTPKAYTSEDPLYKGSKAVTEAMVGSVPNPIKGAVSYYENLVGGETSPATLKRKAAELKKAGALWGPAQIDTLEPAVLDAVYNMQQLADKEGNRIIITSGTDSHGGKSSYHNSGHAIDFRVVKKGKPEGQDYYSASEEAALGRKYAKLTGFAAHLNELEYGPKNHNHASWFNEGMGLEYALKLNDRPFDSKGAKKVFRPSTDNFKNAPKHTSGQYDDVINEHAILEGIPYDLFHGMIKQESAFNPNAVSPTGAKGLGQIMPETLKEMLMGTGQTEEEVAANPRLQAKYSAKYLKKKIQSQSGNFAQGLAAYNAGEGGLAKMKKTGQPYPETLNYVANIMSEVDPEYTPQNKLERAKGQILGTIPSPNLSTYAPTAAKIKAAKLQQMNSEMASNATDGVRFTSDPIQYVVNFGKFLGIDQFNKLATKNSYLADLASHGLSGLFGLSPEDTKAKLISLSGGETNKSVPQMVSAQLVKSMSVAEELYKEVATSLASIPAAFSAKAGLTPAMGPTATQGAILSDPNSPQFLKDAVSYGPDIASMFITGAGWGHVFKGILPKIAPMASKLAGTSMAMLGEGALANSASGAGTLLKSIMTATEHAPAIMTDFATRNGANYLRQTMDPNSPESKLPAAQQLTNFIKAGIGGGIEGLIMSAGPAVFGSVGKMYQGKVLHMESTIPAIGNYLARSDVSTISKTVPTALKTAGLGFSGGLMANMVGLDKTLTGSTEDIPWYKAGIGGSLLGLGGGTLLGIGASVSPALAKSLAHVADVSARDINLWASTAGKAEETVAALQKEVRNQYLPASLEEAGKQVMGLKQTFESSMAEYKQKTEVIKTQIQENLQKESVLKIAQEGAKSFVEQRLTQDPSFMDKVQQYDQLVQKKALAEQKFASVAGSIKDPKQATALKAIQADKIETAKQLGEFIKQNPTVQADSAYMRRLNQIPAQLQKVAESTAELTKQQEIQQYLAASTEAKQNYFTKGLESALENRKEKLGAAWTEGNNKEVLQIIAQELNKEQILPKDVTVPESLKLEPDWESRVDILNGILDNQAKNFVVRANTVGDPQGVIIRAGLSQFGMEADRIKEAHYPNKEQLEVIAASRKKNGVLDKDQAARAFESSKLNWENVRNFKAVTPDSLVGYLESKFPELTGLPFDPKSVSQMDGKILSIPLAKMVAHANQTGDLTQLKQALNTSKLASMLGEVAVPVTGKTDGFKAHMTGVDKAQKLQEALGKNSFEIEGGEQFGISSSEDLFNVGAIQDRLTSVSNEVMEARAKFSVDGGKMTFKPSAATKSANDITDLLINLGSNITDVKASEGLMKAKLNGFSAMLSEVNGTGPQLQESTGAMLSNIGINAITGDAEATKALLTLIEDDSLTERDMGSARLHTFQEEAGKRMMATKKITERIIDHHAPIRDKVLEYVSKVNTEMPEQEFFMDVSDLMFGKKNLLEVTNKWAPAGEEASFKAYVEDLNQISHMSDAIARKNGNSENIFSSYIADILYSDYAPAETLVRREYGASTKLENMFKDFGWDFQNPKQFHEKVDVAFERLKAVVGPKGNPKDFVKLPLIDRMQQVYNVSRESLEQLRDNPLSKKWRDKVAEVDALSFSPYFREARMDPLSLVTKKLRGAAQANTLGDFLQAGSMLSVPQKSGNPQKMVQISKTGPAGYRSLGSSSRDNPGISEAFTDSKLVLGGQEAKGSEVWLHPDYATALDEMFGFKPVSDTAPTLKKLSTMLRQFSLISGAQTFGSQMIAKGLSLATESAYKASSSLRLGEAALKSAEIGDAVIMDHAIKSGLNLSPAWALSARIVEDRIGSMTLEQKKTLQQAKISRQGKGNSDLFFDAANPQSQTAQASGALLAESGVMGKVGEKAAQFASGLTAFDELEMQKGVMQNIDRAMLMAFVNVEQSLARSMGEQLKGIPEQQASKMISKTAAAIVNKNMGAHSEYMGGDWMKSMMQNLYTTPGIQYSRLQTTVEALDTIYSLLGGKKHGLKDKLSDAGVINDRYSHYSEGMRDVLKERTLASFANLALQAAFVSYVYNVAHNGVSPVNHPEGKHFHLSSGDGKYYTLPEFLGGVKSTLRFWDESVGRSDRGENIVLSVGQLLALTEAQKMNPLIKLIAEKALPSASRKSEIHSTDWANATMNFLFGDMIAVREILGGSRGSNVKDLFNMDATGAAAHNNPKDQLLKDTLGMSASADSSANPISFAAAQKKGQQEERMGQIKKLLGVLKNDGSPEDEQVWEKIGGLAQFDMADHPNPKIAELFKNSPYNERVIDLTNQINRQYKKMLDPEGAIADQGTKPGAIQAFDQFSRSKGR